MKKFLILILLSFTSISVFAGNASYSLSKIQQIRLNNFIKQLKIPSWEYKLTVNPTGTRLETYIQIEPQVITKEVETIKEVIKEVPVEKIVEKIVDKPMSLCVDLSKANPDRRKLTEALKQEFDSLVEKNKWYWCSCEYMPKNTVLGCW